MPKLKIMGGGAAQGLVEAIAPRFTAISGFEVEGAFGAVGTMKAKLKAGEAADVVILTSAAIEELRRDRLVIGPTVTDIGVMLTSMAIRAGDDTPALATSDDLRTALLQADGIYLPDPEQATSGVHFVTVLTKLGIRNDVWDRIRGFPSGALAMRELAVSEMLRPIGCTQATEIVATPGVSVAGPLPPGLELATVYTAAVAAHSADQEVAGKLVGLLCGENARSLRETLGFVAS